MTIKVWFDQLENDCDKQISQLPYSVNPVFMNPSGQKQSETLSGLFTQIWYLQFHIVAG